MNNKRRELLKSAISLLDRASSIVNNALDQEQDCGSICINTRGGDG